MQKHLRVGLTKEMLDHDCPYLEGLVKEVMRIFTVNATPLKVTNTTLTIDHKQVPKGWWVYPCISLTHEQDEVSKVDDGSHMHPVRGLKPERWFAKETSPKEYMPWGTSHRLCAGLVLAMTEMKMFLAVFSRQIESFDLVDPTDVDNIEWKFGAINTPKKGVPITLS